MGAPSLSAGRAIAVAQTCPVPGDVEANLAGHVRLARLAAAEGARVVVFPELSLTGYEPGMAAGLAFGERDTRLTALQEAAADGAITIVAGAPVRLGRALHIGAFIIAPDGGLGIYLKQRLGAFGAGARVDGTPPPAQRTVFEPGARDPLVPVGPGHAAVAICADIGRPAHAGRAAARGADVYLASMFVIPSEYDRDADRLRDCAVRHRMTVALANYGAATGGLAAAGRSAIWAPTGELLVQLGPTGPGVAVAFEHAGRWHAGPVAYRV